MKKTPIDKIMGGVGDPVKCAVFPSGNVSFHVWKQNAKPGEKCLCGRTTLIDRPVEVKGEK